MNRAKVDDLHKSIESNLELVFKDIEELYRECEMASSLDNVNDYRLLFKYPVKKFDEIRELAWIRGHLPSSFNRDTQ